MNSLSRRHIQNFSEAASLEPHWGYADRARPCKNDAGSCEYLDVVYHSHDLGMLYSGIIWATVGGILLVWLLTRLSFDARRSNVLALKGSSQPRSAFDRLCNATSSLSRRWLLPESLRPIFGRTTRLQVLILAILLGYLTIWSFVGIVYKKWITPVKNSTLHNTRTSLGPFADRIGLLAYALMPFAIMLSSRESLLSLCTGIPYQHFNFLHRWLGYIIFVQSVVHTIGWTVIETILYQPQPKVGREWIKQKYMIWGIVAQIFVTFIFVSSLPPIIRLTGYEFFRKAHYVVAILFIGACWGHWSNLSCFMIASLVLWFVDRAVRLVRTALMHYDYLPSGKMGFATAKAEISHFPDSNNGDVVRLDFEHSQDAWAVGQHFYLCFPELSIWQSHPFTPASIPQPDASHQHHTYILRSKRGETRNLASLATSRTTTPPSQDKQSSSSNNPPNPTITTPIILTGPYSTSINSHLTSQTNILCIAGGTGITYVLPILLSLAQTPVSPDRKVELIWAIRMENDANWVARELEILDDAASRTGLVLRVYVTRECCTTSAAASAAATAAKAANDKGLDKTGLVLEKEVSTSTSSDSPVAPGKNLSAQSSTFTPSTSSSKLSKDTHYASRPNLHVLTTEFVDNTIRGPTTVFASGPASLIGDLRDVVARCNRPERVWKGDERGDVRLVCDERMEW